VHDLLGAADRALRAGDYAAALTETACAEKHPAFDENLFEGDARAENCLERRTSCAIPAKRHTFIVISPDNQHRWPVGASYASSRDIESFKVRRATWLTR